MFRLLTTIRTIHRIIRDDCSIDAADEHLWAFRGFYEDRTDPHYRARTWQKVQLARIGPPDVVRMSVEEMAFMMRVAMEIEDPIVEYSHQNGEGFRVLLPSLARFMGRSKAEEVYAKAHGLDWCESAWCAEERRHGNAFAKAIERLTNVAPPRDNPNEPQAVTADEDTAITHLVGREAAEWSSSSTYIVMAAHAAGALHGLLRNLARDEIKHLCILSAADRYLRGPRPWPRVMELVRVGLKNYRDQRERRSGGRRIGRHRITAIEVIAAHLLVERRVQSWLSTLPLRTLAAVFETVPEPSPTDPTMGPEERARVKERLAEGRARRAALLRWPPAARRRALGPIGERSRLRAGLRDDQIRNNRHVRGRHARDRE